MPFAEDLLEQAHHLATRDAQGRPRQANLRRAVSSAYYALFHFLVDQACRCAVGMGTEHQALRAIIARSFEHTSMAKASASFASGNLPQKFRPAAGGPIPKELRQVAEAFRSLQEHRHAADYNLLLRFERHQVLLLIGQAQQAMADWTIVQDEPSARLFLFALLVGERLRE